MSTIENLLNRNSQIQNFGIGFIENDYNNFQFGYQFDQNLITFFYGSNILEELTLDQVLYIHKFVQIGSSIVGKKLNNFTMINYKDFFDNPASFNIYNISIKVNLYSLVRFLKSKNAVTQAMNSDSKNIFESSLEAISHELIHFDQITSKRLQLKNGSLYWLGSEISNNKSTTEEYMNLPWEKEAFENQYDFCLKIKEYL